uniref:Uncharacterized protein n=1 Tax=Arundo donax TaxID=35708 RepID=A0A0A8Z3V6_ARUDO
MKSGKSLVRDTVQNIGEYCIHSNPIKCERHCEKARPLMSTTKFAL